LRDDRSDSPTRNLWRHVVLGNWQDTGFWSTGNGWAAAGMLRVLGTIQNSRFATSLRDEVSDLGDWVNEIHDGIYPFLVRNFLI
jgi:rhamnogalacturonyl hydrolase YesR